MRCLSEGIIQAYIDEELNDIEMKEVEMHLFQCKKCKEVYKELKSINNFAMDKLKDYKKNFNITSIKPVNMDSDRKNKKGEFKIMKKYKKITVAACVALAITTCVSVQPIRASVINAVSIFRATDIKSVNISLEDVKKLKSELEKNKSDINIDKIGKVKYQGGEQKNVTIDEAQKTLPFTILYPKNMPSKNIKNISINKPSKCDFTLNIENINELLKSLGGKKLFPKNLDGKTFSLNTGGTLNIFYEDYTNGNHIAVSESKIPELIAPDNASVDEIFNAISDLSILPYDMQKQLKSMKDWKSTLFVPNVENKSEEMTINGMKAIGCFDNNKNSNESRHSYILMLKDDILISIDGNADKNELIEIAKSMR
ncbi:anti-sigma factor family protein [Clostridium scatologenes]|uniref:Putative transmembrane anti-sigma factor n=1 Tax=Clostridium scatologenes TaxID=1548 RepID=A0A0E3JZA0_CLOSL|nr:zf-HC2 domain-containing protein [Clostridium scatologenes]AKA69587.1 putative transmembrane anti-sigma factor [Clostridium scatologenes]